MTKRKQVFKKPVDFYNNMCIENPDDSLPTHTGPETDIAK